MRTAARIERIDHPMLDAGGVGECRDCGRVCTVDDLIGMPCPCGVGVFTRIPRLTDEQKTARVVVMDNEATLKDLIDDPNLMTDKINAAPTFSGFPAGTIAMGEEPKPKPSPE